MRSSTPATVVVLISTVLLILVSVSTPILKQIFFLSFTLDNRLIRLGVFGICVGDTCSAPSVGYTLDVNSLFGFSGLAATSDIPATLINGLTYVLILHPIAAAVAFVAFLLGVLGHMREYIVSSLMGTFASIATSISLIALIFDLVMFIIARNRLASQGITATLGNALWMTLAATILLFLSGCLFCFGRNQRIGRQSSEQKVKPEVNQTYGQAMRQDAEASNDIAYGQGGMYGSGMSKKSSNGGTVQKEQGLPVFGDRNGEVIPLASLRKEDLEEEDGYEQARFNDNASLVSGVGQGYGRRTNPTGRSRSGYSHIDRSNSASTGTVEPFTSMNNYGGSEDGRNVAGIGGGGGYGEKQEQQQYNYQQSRYQQQYAEEQPREPPSDSVPTHIPEYRNLSAPDTTPTPHPLSNNFTGTTIAPSYHPYDPRGAPPSARSNSNSTFATHYTGGDRTGATSESDYPTAPPTQWRR